MPDVFQDVNSVKYVGRFAPSPSGPLHEGSLVAALASYLDARAHRGQWLIRIEDLDVPRNMPGADRMILQQLQQLGMYSDQPVLYQTSRLEAYQQAFDELDRRGLIYPCCCTRREIADSVLERHGKFPQGERPYPGTCRNGLKAGRAALSWRIKVSQGVACFEDRWYGSQSQDVQAVVGDFVLRRADGMWAYQFAVVLDDAWQGVTDVVRGSDLLGSTARQIMLGELLGLPKLRYMHIPVLIDASGRKLSKQNGAPAVDSSRPLEVLEKAWRNLGFESFGAKDVEGFYAGAIERWSKAMHIFRLAPD